MHIKKVIYDSLYRWVISIRWVSMSLIKMIPSRHMRIQFLKWAGAQISPHVAMWHSVDIRNPKGLSIGRGCSIGPRVLLDGRKGLDVGKNVTIAYDAIIWTLHHDMNSVDFHAVGAPVKIGDYSWICSRSIILPGVTIGKYAVVASGAVVTKDVDDYAIVAGIPAIKIGERDHIDYSYEPYNTKHII